MAENDVASSVFKTMKRYTDTMNLNIYDKHLSYIKNIKTYSHKHMCEKCSKLFKTSIQLKRHKNSCEKKNNLVFPGGFFNLPKTIFEELEINDIFVKENDRFYDWYIVYDLEAVLLKTSIKTTKTEWNMKHVPISVSICSNVMGFDKPFCIVETNSYSLIEQMLNRIRENCLEIKRLAEKKWSDVLISLNEKIDYYRDLCHELDEKDNQMLLKDLILLRNKFVKYTSEVPIIGFNSS